MGLERRYRSIEGEELYRKLAIGEPIFLLDVRTETEFATSHIPGSVLVPLHEIESRWPEIPNGNTPVAVVCAHGIRSASACGFLAEHGISPLYNLAGGLSAWPGPLSASRPNGNSHDRISPSRFLVENFDVLPKGLALDLAMGNGRNAIYLAARGFDVDCVDVDPDVVARARCSARKLGTPIRAVVGNVEDGTYILPIETYDVIVVFHYLHRPLFNDIREGLKPGGVVVYETFTTEQERFGPPRNPAFLLRPGELKQTFADWEILRYHEGVEPGTATAAPRAVAGIIARKPV